MLLRPSTRRACLLVFLGCPSRLPGRPSLNPIRNPLWFPSDRPGLFSLSTRPSSFYRSGLCGIEPGSKGSRRRRRTRLGRHFVFASDLCDVCDVGAAHGHARGRRGITMVAELLRRVDSYPKVNEDFATKTRSGGAITLVALLVMAALVWTELSAWMPRRRKRLERVGRTYEC